MLLCLPVVCALLIAWPVALDRRRSRRLQAREALALQELLRRLGARTRHERAIGRWLVARLASRLSVPPGVLRDSDRLGEGALRFGPRWVGLPDASVEAFIEDLRRVVGRRNGAPVYYRRLCGKTLVDLFRLATEDLKQGDRKRRAR